MTTSYLALLAREWYAEGPVFQRFLQCYRPYICPFEQIIPYIPKQARVLDIGAGCGLFLLLLRQFGRASAGLGIDVNARAIAYADQIARLIGATELQFRCLADLSEWPTDLVDAVTLIDVLHHVQPAKQRQFLVAASERVASEGTLLIKDIAPTPHWRATCNRVHDLLLARQWVHYLYPTEIRAWLASCGLECVEESVINRLWYGHMMLVFRRLPPPSAQPAPMQNQM